MKRTLVVTSFLPLLFLNVILAGILLATPLVYVRGNPGGHISVTNSPVPVGQPIQIQFSVDPGDTQAVALYIRNPGGGNDLWDYNVPYAVVGGTTYTQNAPGLSAPGTYTAGIIEFVGGTAGSYAETTFQVVGGGGGGTTIAIYVCFSGSTEGCRESIPVGQPITLDYEVHGGSGGMGTLYIRPSSSSTHIWEETADFSTCIGYCNGRVPVPAITTPGSYVAGIRIALPSGSAATWETPFTVGTSSGAGFDFTLAFSPSTLSVTAGGVANFPIIVTFSNPAYSSTTITVQQVTGLGAGMNYQLIPSPPTLVISTSTSTPASTYTITLIGSANGVTHQVSATLIVQAAQQAFDFSIAVSPSDRTLNPGGSVTYTVTVNLVAGATQSVALSVPDAPSGVTAAFSQTSGSPPFTSTLTVSASQSASPGNYPLTVTGTGGGKSHTAPATLIIGAPPDFRVEVDPPSQTVLQGQTASYSVHVVGLNGFNSQVSLTIDGLPAGVTGVFSVPSSSPDFTTTLTLTVPSDSPTGSFTLTITGSGNGISRLANAVLTVNPTAQTQSQTQATTQTGGGPSTPNDLLGMIQQNSLLVIGLLAIVIVLFGVLALRGRKPSYAPRPSPQAQLSPFTCSACGTQNPAGNEFCANCGSRLQ